MPHTLKRECLLQGFPCPLSILPQRMTWATKKKRFPEGQRSLFYQLMQQRQKGSWFSIPTLNPSPRWRDEIFDCLPHLNLCAKKMVSPTAPSTSPLQPLAHILDHVTWHTSNWTRDIGVPDPGHHSMDWPTVTWPEKNGDLDQPDCHSCK